MGGSKYFVEFDMDSIEMYMQVTYKNIRVGSVVEFIKVS